MKLIQADWPAPAHIHALASTRQGGVSTAPYDSLNLGDHVGDQPVAVAQNRDLLLASQGLHRRPQWLQQVHGTTLVKASDDGSVPQADACWSDQPGQACIVMTADCLPVLFTDRLGTKVAAAHAGWRGLAEGILEQTLQIFADPAEVMVWLGPAIGQAAFEVGDEVRERFCELLPRSEAAFIPGERAGKWQADICQLARLRLQRAGVRQIHGGGFCTYADSARFFSYRRQAQTGRLASMIWIADQR
ncbi:peptidoglycan editing factor PgeF [Marinobacterium jannaschii]|uniref:peptidoglycan editing factor PgeF n=1 Tax=Marinobacterium jannaschii TaxID=64970 RepID=UPI0004899044|nr:peptidoglycan editing factor PgeF [Marinobacterium jannaschii]